MSVEIIAEAGVNHNGDIDLAVKLIESASKSGADFVKFQSFKADDIVSQTTQLALYQKGKTSGVTTQYEMLKKLELDDDQTRYLIRACKNLGIQFLSSPFSIERAEFLRREGLATIKIASGEITNLPLFDYVARQPWNVVFSTGMSTLDEIEQALQTLLAYKTSEQITILLCTSGYPTPPEEVHLNFMQTLKEEFNTKVGFSDHTQGIHIPIAAVAMGAGTIEKHFTLDRSMSGPDHLASIEPLALEEMVKQIREVELSFGSKQKPITKTELQSLTLARKSIVAKGQIKKGELFSEENLTTRRPGDGMSPAMWNFLLGTAASKSYLPGENIEERI